MPVLLQLLIWYNLGLAFTQVGIPCVFTISTNALISPFVAALFGLGLNESAYMAEIVRAGFNSIDKGQIEAAHAIGMTPAKTLAPSHRSSGHARHHSANRQRLHQHAEGNLDSPR